MPKFSVHEVIMNLDRPIFTSKEIAAMTERSVSSVSTTLKLIGKRGAITKITQGVWAYQKSPRFNLLSVAHFLLQGHQVYISFITALHIYEMISQIPKVIYAASTAHAKLIKTSLATYSFHQISPPLFTGFDWYKGKESFLIATPEKALIDSIYISSRKGKRFGYFPELNFPKSFSIKKAKEWTELIEEQRIRLYVRQKLNEVCKHKKTF